MHSDLALNDRKGDCRWPVGVGLLTHSDPFALLDSHLFLALEAPQLHQNTSFAAQRLSSAYQEFERFGAVSKTALERTVALL
jgi:hypothetical protein